MFAKWCLGCLDFLIPFDCAGCDNSVSTAHVWCADCVTHVATFDNQHAVIDTGALPVIAAYDYAGPVKHAIHRFKFNGRSDLAGRLARDVARAVGHYPLPSNAVLVPVPLTPQRLVERGYNQAALLANAIARQLRLRHFPLALRRVHDGSHQVGANKIERAGQVATAFVAVSRCLQDCPVVVVDDVVTTGATATACAQALRAAGAQVVAVAAVAKVA